MRRRVHGGALRATKAEYEDHPGRENEEVSIFHSSDNFHGRRRVPSDGPHKLRKSTHSAPTAVPASQNVRPLTQYACTVHGQDLDSRSHRVSGATARRSRCSSRSGRRPRKDKLDRLADRKPAFQSGNANCRHLHPCRRRPCPRFRQHPGSSLLGSSACRGRSRNARMCSSSCLRACTVGRAPGRRDHSRCRCRRSRYKSRGRRTPHSARGTCSIQSSHSRSV